MAATNPNQPEPRYVAGIDWGHYSHPTVMVVIDATKNVVAQVYGFTGIGFATLRGNVLSAYDEWKPTVILAESNSIGAVNVEALQAEGLPIRPFTVTAKNKNELYAALAAAVVKGHLKLGSDDALLNMSEDLKMALALAWWGVIHSGPIIDFV
jgi:hypothetical protein